MAMHKLMLLLMSISICMFLQYLCPLEAAPEDYLVTSLPGFKGTFPSKHYSGYVTLDGNPPKNLFYYFVASERSPGRDPVVLWLNGGPGCSSFDGFVYEHGPFNFEAAKHRGGLPVLHLNPHSWSKVASIIYLDSPVGVGFSYSANTTYYVTGDLQTAAETHLFLLKWFEQFPEFTSNPFYISGESYAGIYIPTLASDVVKGIKNGAKPVINFKGYMVGNGVCDPGFDGNALVPFAHGMGLISANMFKEAEVLCKGNYHNSINAKCQKILYKIDRVLDDLNRYDILEPCFHNVGLNDVANENTSGLPQSFNQLGQTERPLAVRKRMFGRAWPFRAPVEDGIIPLWPQLMRKITVPCMRDDLHRFVQDDVQATIWLNNDAVRKAIHASPESGNWSLCVDLRYTHDAGSMLSYHKNLTSSGYRVLIYSGDHDMCVPFTGTQAWTQSLGYKIVDEWRPWKSNRQVAGFIQEYANDFTFLTIKGAGHTVPEYKPRESLHFFTDAPDASDPITETDNPNVAPVVPPTTTLPSGQFPATATVPTTDLAPVVPTEPAAPVVAPVPDVPPVTTPVTTPSSGAAATSTTTAAATSATTAAATSGDHSTFSFFMHDILGGSQPSGRVVAGIVANSDANNLPFSKPNNQIFPINGGVPLNTINGVINNNNYPFLVGLNGSPTNTLVQSNGNNVVTDNNNQAFVTAGQLPQGLTIQQLMFGSVTVVDNEITEGHELGTGVLGKAQGFYITSSTDGSSHTLVLTALFHGGDHHEIVDTVSFFGVHRTATPMSQIAVVGGTGKYENAKGYATIETLPHVDQHTTDGVETITHFTVYLTA
ncbi:UNVERIFIED_CONTAM: Serine carboxypeptidase-like 20 [Sesamum calycinum]|uniref:Serine carboxypeptidase-like 20 n=1 Tax=Sesamum calycinum TaxID=2727403 RepID=A0AAW2LSV0_9LAMI